MLQIGVDKLKGRSKLLGQSPQKVAMNSTMIRLEQT